MQWGVSAGPVTGQDGQSPGGEVDVPRTPPYRCPPQEGSHKAQSSNNKLFKIEEIQIN